MKISLFCKNHDQVYAIEEACKNEAFSRGIDIDDKNPDVIIYIGGDGTFLNAVQNNIDRLDDVIFVGINTGSLGFFYEFRDDEIKELFEYLCNGSLKLRRINLMQGFACNKKDKFEFYALNEIRLIGKDASLKCDVEINDELLESYAGNEIVVSSSAGSTGLNKSVGGAVIHPDIATFQITPIAPINNACYSCITNPIVLYNNIDITLKSKTDAILAFDYITIDEPVNFVNISRSNLYASVFFRPDRTFIDKLKESFIK